MEFPPSLIPSDATVANLLTGLYSSAIFLFVLTLLKPRIKICDKIAHKHDETADEGKKHHYSFKVVNKSLFFKVYDMQVRTWVSKIEPSTNADDISYEKIELVKDYQWVINRLYVGHLFQQLIHGDTRLENRTDYAAQFGSYSDISQCITNGSYVTIEIIAKHSLTGFSRVISKKYKHSSDIITGHFYSGNCCKVKI